MGRRNPCSFFPFLVTSCSPRTNERTILDIIPQTQVHNSYKRAYSKGWPACSLQIIVKTMKTTNVVCVNHVHHIYIYSECTDLANLFCYSRSDPLEWDHSSRIIRRG